MRPTTPATLADWTWDGVLIMKSMTRSLTPAFLSAMMSAVARW